MENYRTKLLEQKEFLDSLIKRTEKDLNKLKNLPDCKIKVSKSNGCTQYYFVSEQSPKPVYAKVSQRKIVEKILQRDYEKSVNKKAGELSKALDKFLKHYNFDSLTQIYEQLPEAKKTLIVPVIETDESYISDWMSTHPGNQNSFPIDGGILTSRGEYVRSKSEKIIADLLDKMNIPYAYEPQLELNNYHVIYPDFAVLNVRKRKIIYWEHFGLIDSQDYAVHNFKKLNEYERSGIEIGEDLIITMESTENVIDSKMIEEKIKKYCL